MIIGWKNELRPGYFGRRRDEKIRELNDRFGEGKWRLAHVTPLQGGAYTEERYRSPSGYLSYEFVEACRFFYEQSYYHYLFYRIDDVDFICTFGECYDNAVTNVQSGLDYSKQEAFSTHIQDIAIRNALSRLGRHFSGPPTKLLQIRSASSEGYRFGPGNVPFMDPRIITQPSLSPSWAQRGSVEDFWQSNKWVQTPIDDGIPDLEV